MINTLRIPVFAALLLAGAVTAAEYSPPGCNEFPGFGWYEGGGIPDAVIVRPINIFCSSPVGMELEFRNIRRAAFSFAFLPLGKDGKGIRASDYDGVSLAVRGTGFKTDFLRVGLSTSGEKRVYFYETPLEDRAWKRVEIPFNSFRSADLLSQISSDASLETLALGIKSREREQRVYVDDIAFKRFGRAPAPIFPGQDAPNTPLVPGHYLIAPAQWKGLQSLLKEVRGGKPMRIAVLGDCTVMGPGLWNWEELAQHLTWPRRLEHMLKEQLGSEKVTVQAFSSIEDTLVDDATHRIQINLFGREIRAESGGRPSEPTPPPDVAILAYGCSDALSSKHPIEEFKRKLTESISTLQRRNVANIVLVNSVPVVGKPELTQRHAEAVRDTAAAEGLPCIDVFNALYRGTNNAAKRIYMGEYMATENQPNRRGHQIIAELVMQAFVTISGTETPK